MRFIQHLFRKAAPAAVFAVLLAACTSDQQPAEDPAAGWSPDARYYSLRDFVKDQYTMLAGQPLAILRVTSRGGQRDSVLLPMHEVKWSEIYKAVNEADISDRKFLGRYRFSDVFDSTIGQRSLVYEAAEPQLPTRMMLISVNAFNDRIASIYVQYAKNGLERRMFYEPRTYLRLDEERQGAARNLRTEYFWQ